MATIRSGRMGDTVALKMKSLFGKTVFTAVFYGVFLASCAAVAPVLTGVAAKFAQDLLSVSAYNVSPRYASDIERLFVALLSEQAGLDSHGQQDRYGNNYPQGQYPNGGQQDPYANSYPQDQYSNSGQQDPYANNYPQNQYPNSGQQDPYGNNNPQGQYPNTGQQETYGYNNVAPNQYPVQSRGAPVPISMEVGILAQKMQSEGTVTLEAIPDGGVLRDGRGNPEAGDKLKFSLRANCDCYAYVIGIDATGFLAQIFPDTDSGFDNPLTAGRQYLFPEGDVWWGLDEFRGVETVYFIASHTRRTDIEEIISSMASTKRRLPEDYRTVQVAAVIPDTRGLVKVQSAAPTKIMTESGSTQEVTPTAFTAAVTGVDLVITRWFEHQ